MRGYTDRARIITVLFEASSSRREKARADPTFGIERHEHTSEFPTGSGFAEVGGEACWGYPSDHGDAEGVEHFL
jgi:hypothetical protein